MVSNSGMMLSPQRRLLARHQQAHLLEQQRHLQHVAGGGGHRDDVVRDRAVAEAGAHARGRGQRRQRLRRLLAVGDVRRYQRPRRPQLAQQQRLALGLGAASRSRGLPVARASSSDTTRSWTPLCWRRSSGHRWKPNTSTSRDQVAQPPVRRQRRAVVGQRRARSRPDPRTARPDRRTDAPAPRRRRSVPASTSSARAVAATRAKMPTSARRYGSSSRLVPRSGERAASACSSGDVAV